MGLFGNKDRTSVALIDISSSSVGGGLAHLSLNELPTLYYTERLPIELRESEKVDDAMLRTLNQLADLLVKKGAPALRRETGSGHVDRIIISVSAPWQTTNVRVESIQGLKPFVFTRTLMEEAVKKNAQVPEGYSISGETTIATMLNGYEMENPFGKKVTRAELIILSSFIEKSVADRTEAMLRKTYHTHALTLTAFAPLAYTIFRDLYPHEKDFLVLDISGEATDIVFVKQNLLVNVGSMPHGINELMRKARDASHRALPSNPDIIPTAHFSAEIEQAQQEWLSAFAKTLQEFSAQHALPRTLFLLANPDSRDFLKNLLDSPSLRSLWLTDEPLTIIPVAPSHFNAYVKTRGLAESDAYLILLALFSNKNQLLPAVH